MVKVVEVEATPNPDALKFITDARLVAAGAKSFDTPDAALGDPLAEALFKAGPIRSVFYMDRFVTVTKPVEASWADLQRPIVTAIEASATPAAAPAENGAARGAAEDALAKINQIIDENVRPALAGDGGGLQILDFSNKVLTVHYQGACGSCPSATTGTLFAIQNLLQRMVDPEIQVVSD